MHLVRWSLGKIELRGQEDKKGGEFSNQIRNEYV